MAKWQAGGKATQVIAMLIPLGIRISDRPSDSQTIEEDTSLISPHLLYKIIFLSSQSDRVLAGSIPLKLLAAAASKDGD
jgi:hypothetical protein